MDSITETMERIDGLFERFAPALLRQPCLPEPPLRKRRESVKVWHSREVRAHAEALLLGGRTPKEVSEERKLPYGTVLSWSMQLGLKFRRGPKGPRRKLEGVVAA